MASKREYGLREKALTTFQIFTKPLEMQQRWGLGGKTVLEWIWLIWLTKIQVRVKPIFKFKALNRNRTLPMSNVSQMTVS